MLSFKTQIWFHAATKFIRNYDFLFKADEDSFVEVDRLLDYLQTTKPDYWGFLHTAENRYGMVIRQDENDPVKNVWAVPYDVYDREAYPPYMQGAGYAISRDFSACLAQQLPTVHYLPSEDVIIGLLAKLCKIEPTKTPRIFTAQAGPLQQFDPVRWDYLVVHKAKNMKVIGQRLADARVVAKKRQRTATYGTVLARL